MYLRGTQTLATIYSDQNNTPLANPFIASVTGSWTFYATTGIPYDVFGSGGIFPNVYLQPTLINPGGSGAGGASPPQYSVQYANNNQGQFGSDAAITINPFQHSFNVAGNGTGLIGLCGASSSNCVNITVDPNTAAWNFTWPTTVPLNGSGINCLTAQNSGIPLNAGIATWQPCITYVNAAADPTMGDIGAKVTNAAANCAYQCTVYVPPGNYNYSTTMSLPLEVLGNYALLLDKGAVINYAGAFDAIATPVVNSPNVSTWRISGGHLNGTSLAQSGVHVLPTNSVSITGMVITGFTGGAGIWLDGANGVTVFDNDVQGNQVGVQLSPTYCAGANCGISVVGSAYTPNQIAINSNRITGNSQWNIISTDPATSLLTGALNVAITYNDLELGGSAGSTFGAVRVGRSHSLTIIGNYFEGSPRQIVLGIPGGGDGNQFRFYSSQGCHVGDNYFTDQTTTPYDIELLDTADCRIDNNTTLNVSRNSSNCFINTLTNNGTNIGETGTVLGPNHIENYGTGSTLCIAGAPVNNLVGAGSFPIVNSNYTLQLVAPNYTITSSGTSETVNIPGLTTGAACSVIPSPNVPGAAATAIASTLTTTSTPGVLTMTHPSGTLGAHVAFACNSGPLN